PEVDGRHIGGQLFRRDRVPEAQIAIVRIQGEKVTKNAAPVLGAQVADGHPVAWPSRLHLQTKLVELRGGGVSAGHFETSSWVTHMRHGGWPMACDLGFAP